MKNRSSAVAFAVAALFVSQYSLAAPATQPVANVPVKEVVLYSSGVGYFEHDGTIQGDGSTELRFKTDQINDILKSLVLQDLDGGKVSAVTYASQDPIAKTLKSFQVDITANPPMADLLNQLRGAKVTITVSGEKTTGVILGVEMKKKPVEKGEPIDQPFLNLVTGAKIISQAMDAVNSIELDDPALQEELNKALVALAGARDQDKKPVKITFSGAGERRVRLGYVVETPIWKTSYRLILGPSADKAAAATRPTLADGKLQGWAIVENQTDNDWNNVQLSLVSGRPISFIENLYQPLYIPRPVVEPELFASLRPQVYDAGVAMAPAAMPPRAMQQMANQAYAKNAFGVAGGRGGVSQMRDEEVAESRDFTKSVQSIASASKVGELFQYTIRDPVTLPRQRSAMLPIITDPVEVERLSIYNPRVMAKNPLTGARVKNTTKNHLLAGPITVFDGVSYAGDAQIDNVPPGQERLLSYGVDLEMVVDSADDRLDNQIQTGKIVKGVLFVTRKMVQTQDYTAQNKSDHDKVLIVEHHRTQGWDLVDSPTPIEKTDAVYRFRETVPAGKTVKLTVNEQMIQDETLAVLNSDPGQVEFYRQRGAIPQAVKDALAKAIQLRQAMTDTQRQIDEARNHLSDITAEQSRIRDDLKSVKETTQYYTRLTTKLNDQETEIEKTQKTQEDLKKQFEQQRADFEGYVNGLNVG